MSSAKVHGKPCRKGHTLRYAASGNCVECSKAATQAYQGRNPDKVRQWVKTSAARGTSQSARAKAAWKARNPDKVAADARERARLRKLGNPRAIPPWADRAAIRSIYLEAVRTTKRTGVLHVVDHIVPLKGSGVCGLHVENNLQIITKPENDDKWRYYDGFW